jgi:hypothetical protein
MFDAGYGMNFNPFTYRGKGWGRGIKPLNQQSDLNS